MLGLGQLWNVLRRRSELRVLLFKTLCELSPTADWSSVTKSVPAYAIAAAYRERQCIKPLNSRTQTLPASSDLAVIRGRLFRRAYGSRAANSMFGQYFLRFLRQPSIVGHFFAQLAKVRASQTRNTVCVPPVSGRA